MALEIRKTEEDGSVHLEVIGELDSTTASDLEAAIDAALTESVQRLVLDLAGLEFVSSAGLRVFAKAQRAMRDCGGSSYFVNPTSQVRRVFEFVQAVKLEDIFDNDADLDRHLETIHNPPGS